MSGRLTLLAIVAACGRSAPPPVAADPRAADRARAAAEEANEQALVDRDFGTCDDESYDFRRPACRYFCPSYPVRGNPTCGDSRCPRDAPRADVSACQHTMACPTPPDRRVRSCMRAFEQLWPPCDRQRPSLANPRCDGLSRVPGTLIELHRRDDGRYELHIAPCGERGVAAGWRGHLVNTESGADVAGTDFEVTGAYDECTAVTAAAIEPTLIEHSTRVWMDPP